MCNVDDKSAVNGNKYVDMVREATKDENAEILIVAAQTESEIAEFETYEERQMFLEEIGLKESGVSRLDSFGVPSAQLGDLLYSRTA